MTEPSEPDVSVPELDAVSDVAVAGDVAPSPADDQTTTDGDHESTSDEMSGSPVDLASDESPSELTVICEQMESLGLTLDGIRDELALLSRRNHAQEAIVERLQDAEQQLKAASAHPFALALNRILTTLSSIDIDDDVRAGLTFEIAEVLAQQGYEIFGAIGDEFDVRRHDALAGRIADGAGFVDKVYSQGLLYFGRVVVKARVSVEPQVHEAADPPTDKDG